MVSGRPQRAQNCPEHTFFDPAAYPHMGATGQRDLDRAKFFAATPACSAGAAGGFGASTPPAITSGSR
jgi:hypothetical protein